MVHPLAVPFALPGPEAAPPRVSPLGMPHFVTQLAGTLLVPFTLAILLQPWVDDQLAQRDVLAFRTTFGFDVGEVANEWGGSYWGFTAITPDGIAEEAGLRAEDVPFTRHGGSGMALRGAIGRARAGEEACFEVINLRERRAGRDGFRTVCLPPQDPARPIRPVGR
jgi:hypothetical protein